MRRSYDESDVRIRPGKGSRPRTKDRPQHKDAVWGMVVTKDRGRWGVVLDNGRLVTSMRARELGRTSIVVGDRVGLVGDTSGKPGTLARLVKVADRTSVLRRTADDNDPYERVVVANADQLLIVTAAAEPTPRSGFVERALVAAYVGGLDPILCMTKTDLADPAPFVAHFAGLDLRVIYCGTGDDISAVREATRGKVTALIGHSGVGKSTLVNRLVPDAARATGEVSGVGKGRHTSTQSVALRLPYDAPAPLGGGHDDAAAPLEGGHDDAAALLEGGYEGQAAASPTTSAADHSSEMTGGDSAGWIIDTPGVRSFGLAHVKPETLLDAFQDLAELVENCPRGCTHLGPPADPECALDSADGATAERVHAVRTMLEALSHNEDWDMDLDRS